MTTPLQQAAQAIELTDTENIDCTPNHICGGRMVHLPDGEMCDKCGWPFPPQGDKQ